ncbi:MAG: outer membrane protein [Sphingomonadales bacterium]
MRAYLIVAAASLLSMAAATPAMAEGFRAEVHGGWDRPSVDHEGDSGIVYGVGLGYDMNIGSNVFAGVDLSFDDSTQKDCARSVIAANDRFCESAGRDLAAGVRLGVNVTPQGKLYALAGYTNARFKVSYTTPAGVRSHDSENFDGFGLGAGYQHSLGGNTYAKAEYRYSNYEHDIDRHQLLVGVGVTF